MGIPPPVEVKVYYHSSGMDMMSIEKGRGSEASVPVFVFRVHGTLASAFVRSIVVERQTFALAQGTKDKSLLDKDPT